MEAIILVAGRGIRLKPLTNDIPKCLIEVNGKVILDNALEIFEQNGIKKVTLVIGYFGNKIKQHICDKFKGMDIHYVENKFYDQTNTSYSLWLALKNLDPSGALLILEGDVFFEKKLIMEFLCDESTTSTAVQKYNSTLDGSFVELRNGNVVDWIHKNNRRPDFIVDGKFKTVNIYKFDSSFVNNLLKPVLRQHIEEKKGEEPLEYVMQDIITKRMGIINAFDVGNLKWFEIDDVGDLKIAEEIFK